MEPTDLTVKILQEIRDGVRETNTRIDHLGSAMDARFEQVNTRFDQVNARFEVVETTLKDLAEQMVMLARGIKTALEVR